MLTSTRTRDPEIRASIAASNNEVWHVVAGPAGDLLLVPKAPLQRALDRYHADRTRDAQGPQNNLHGRVGSSNGGWDRLPGRSRDEGAGQSQGTQRSAGGGAPRRAPPPSKPPGAKAGAFTIDQPPGHSSTSQQHRFPYRPYNANRTETDDGLIEGLNKVQKFGEHLQNDEDPEEEDLGLGEKIGEVDPPPEGMVYQLQPQPDGSIAIVCVEDDGSDLNQNAAMLTHSLGDAANRQFFKRLNGIHRRKWSRTRDADFAASRQTTIYRHHLGPGERIELQGPNEAGSYDLVPFSRTADLTGPVQPGARGSQQSDNPGTDWPAQNWAASPGSRPGARSIHELDGQISTGDRRMTEPQRLASMNRAAAAFWAR